MGMILAHEPMTGGPGAEGYSGQYIIAGVLGRALGVAAIAACVAAPMAAFAADSTANGGSGEGNSGYYGQFYQPGEVPAANVTVAPEDRVSTTVPPPSNRYVAPDASSLVYQPGFQGCAPGVDIGSGGSLGGMRTGAAGTRQHGKRSVRFGISVSETYTDNVNLASDGNTEDAYVTEVVPTLKACANSGRIKATLDYQLQALYYLNEDSPFEVYHDVSGTTTIEVLSGHLFLAADTSYSQTVIDASEGYADSNILRSGNQTSAWITNISPYWFQRLGPLGHATLRYRYGRAEYGSDEVSDYTMQGVYLTMSGPQTSPIWSYQLSIGSQRVDNEGAANAPAATGDEDVTHFDSATLRVGYNVTDSLKVFATGGAETEYAPNGDEDRYGSAIWNTGFRWSSLRNSLEASYGHRSFGPSYSITATHQAARFNLAVSYTEDTTAPGMAQLNHPDFGGAGSGSFGLRNGSPRDRGVYVRKRLLATVGFDTARTHTTVQAYDSTREYVMGNQPDEDIYGATVGITYQLGVRTRLNSHVNWEHRKSGTDEAKYGELGMGVTYQVTRSSQIGLSYSHSWRNDESDADDYDENQVVLRYSKFF